ncbi:MAG TPA: FAD-binding oxidoreductase, partial [Xanthobacteraceae bacterium]|nr:FAD-binding oxidoreductase [Xanthobacteraceae bacterium]
MTTAARAANRPDLHAGLAALRRRLGERLTVAPAVREQHGNTTTWVANQPPDAVAFPASEDEVQAIVR